MPELLPSSYIIKFHLSRMLTKTPLREAIIRRRHAHLNPNSLYLASYPRSGSTWLKFLLYGLLTLEQTDFPEVDRTIPYYSRAITVKPLLPNSRYLLRTHEPYRNEYKTAIYIVRDARDVVISEYFYSLGSNFFDVEFDVYLDLFIKGRTSPSGSWQDHVNSWINAYYQSPDKFIIIKYEELLRDTEGIVLSILEFLKVERKLDEIRRVIAQNSFEEMRIKEKKAPRKFFKSKRKLIPFIRQRSIYGWQEFLSDKQIALIEEKMGSTLNKIGYRTM